MNLDIVKAEQYTVGQWMDVWFENCAKIKNRYPPISGPAVLHAGGPSPVRCSTSQRRQFLSPPAGTMPTALRICISVSHRRPHLAGQRTPYAPPGAETGGIAESALPRPQTHICDPGPTKRSGHQNRLRDAGPLLRRIHPGHLHPRHHLREEGSLSSNSESFNALTHIPTQNGKRAGGTSGDSSARKQAIAKPGRLLRERRIRFDLSKALERCVERRVQQPCNMPFLVCSAKGKNIQKNSSQTGCMKASILPVLKRIHSL